MIEFWPQRVNDASKLQGQQVAIDQLLILAAGFFVIALLYTSVGHAGASGYLAAMALLGVAPAAMRPVALVLNILVASFTVYRFSGAGFFKWRNLWPFLIGSVPFAAVGGSWKLPNHQYYYVVAAALLISAVILLWRAYRNRLPDRETQDPIPVLPALFIGAAIGLLSGLTGTGGGIFLSPIILITGWAAPKETSGISAPFILVNSAVALIAGSLSWAALPVELPWLALAALTGALAGTWLGLKKLRVSTLLSLLAAVLVIAAVKLLLTA
jgi:uncharacterized membrane protein YfcA